MILLDLRRIRRNSIIILCLIFIAILAFFLLRSVETGVTLPVEDLQYKGYTGYEGKLMYKLPVDWKLSGQSFEDSEILYHNEFTSGDKKIHGYIEIWNLNKPLINFIKESKKSAVGIITFKYYNAEPVKINGKDGYILQYSRLTDGNKYIKAFEVFILDSDNLFHRMAFYMDEGNWKNEYRTMFLNMAAMIELK